jgi:hypothetical protein
LADQDEFDWKEAPLAPEDVFAVTGVLLEDSGALSFFGVESDKPHLRFPKLSISADELSELDAVAKEWKPGHGAVPPKVSELWSELMSYCAFPLNYKAYRFKRTRQVNDQFWWRPAYRLFILSDNACEGIGFTPRVKDEDTMAGQYWRLRSAGFVYHQRAENEGIKDIELPSSLAAQANPDVICVQPKSLVPTVGAGTRVFSKNIALLRPRGLVRTQWSVNTHLPKARSDVGLNVLIIPFPWDEFGPEEFDVSQKGDERVFRLEQSWLEDKPFEDFRSACRKMIDECHTIGKPVHAIVLPELALNQKRFLEFARFAKKFAHELEFIVAGSSENCERGPRVGNYIWIRKYLANEDGIHTLDDHYFDVSQSKHHRWKLDGSQIRGYAYEQGIAGGLAEEPHWENFAGRPREVNFFSFRERSALCCIVCEDLARSEPCHEIIKSVGPNILFGLLLDGPQIGQRWGAKYASLFAADHGGAVITVASRGLVARSQAGRDDQNFSVAYVLSPNMSEPLAFECRSPRCGVFVRLVPDRDFHQRSSRNRNLIDGRKKLAVDWVVDQNFGPRVVGLD